MTGTNVTPMVLRPIQELAVGRCTEALEKNDNTLLVAPTASGKTVIFTEIIRILHELGLVKKTLVIVHRDELVKQTINTIEKQTELSTSKITANEKKNDGDVIVAMVQTLHKKKNISLLSNIDLLIIDEAHHSCAPTYLEIINHIKESNPDSILLGVTATPIRGDGKGLGRAYTNTAYRITYYELIEAGLLVRPVFFVARYGDELEQKPTEIRKDAAEILDVAPVTSRVVSEWQEKCGTRKTVAYCSNKEHARHIASAFCGAGINTETITGDAKKTERKRILHDFENGDIQVLVNVFVLTEGWDCPACSCIILLRPCSQLSTLIQMIGRALRLNDGKDDAIIMDFGSSLKKHKEGIEEEFKSTFVNLEDRLSTKPQKISRKTCPECGTVVYVSVKECPECHHLFVKEREQTDKVDVVHIDLFQNKSRINFSWCDISAWRDTNNWGKFFVAGGFGCWACVYKNNNNDWCVVGGIDKCNVKLIIYRKNQSEINEIEDVFCSAEDFLDENVDGEKAIFLKKGMRWHSRNATQPQLNALQRYALKKMPTQKYAASCVMTWVFNERKILELLGC